MSLSLNEENYAYRILEIVMSSVVNLSRLLTHVTRLDVSCQIKKKWQCAPFITDTELKISDDILN